MTILSRKRLYCAAAFAAFVQSAVLFTGIEQRASDLRNGANVEVSVGRVDPRDLLRGDYVVLDYDFAQILRSEVSGNPEDGSRRKVYIALKKAEDGLWHKSRAAFSFINDLGQDEVQIAGETLYMIGDDPDSYLTLKFGIERYYVPEGEGKDIEAGLGEDRMTILLAVVPAGRARIKALLDDGKPLYREPLY